MASRRAALVVAVGLLAARVAEAAPPTHTVTESLHVEPNPCFDAASLAPVLARWLHRDTIDRRLEVVVVGQPRRSDGLTLRVRRDGTIVGERHFPGLEAPCEEVRAAVGLAAALAVDATVLESLGVKAEPAAPPPAPPPVTPRAWPGFSASLDAIGLFGVLPSPAAAIAPAFGVRLVSPIELRFSGLISTAGALSLESRSFDVTLLAGRADACGAFSQGIFRVRACAGISAGRLRATSTDPSSSVSQIVPWAAAMGHADLRVSLVPRFGFVLGADLIFPLARPRFEVVTTAGALAASSGLPVVGGAVSFGPELTFR